MAPAIDIRPEHPCIERQCDADGIRTRGSTHGRLADRLRRGGGVASLRRGAMGLSATARTALIATPAGGDENRTRVFARRELPDVATPAEGDEDHCT